jgi:hypothetical protein
MQLKFLSRIFGYMVTLRNLAYPKLILVSENSNNTCNDNKDCKNIESLLEAIDYCFQEDKSFILELSSINYFLNEEKIVEFLRESGSNRSLHFSSPSRGKNKSIFIIRKNYKNPSMIVILDKIMSFVDLRIENVFFTFKFIFFPLRTASY